MSNEETFVLDEARREMRALEYIKRDPMLKQAFNLEPDLYSIVHRVNAIVRLENRDAAYSQFKKDLARLVGHHAPKPELQTSGHYEAMLRLLTLLLSWHTEQPSPRNIEEEETSETSELMSIDAVVRQTLRASREASLQAFRSLVEQQQ